MAELAAEVDATSISAHFRQPKLTELLSQRALGALGRGREERMVAVHDRASRVPLCPQATPVGTNAERFGIRTIF